MEPVDDDATIVFSGKADMEKVEEKKRSAVREDFEGEEGPPRRRARMSPTVGCPACSNVPRGNHNEKRK
eukprot:15568612-Heterocapsa_arctica.AAC.1